MSSERDPTYWRNLYKAPRDTDDEAEASGFHVLIEAEDLVAERLGGNEGEQGSPSPSGAVDPAAVTALVNKLLTKRLEELVVNGVLSSSSVQRPSVADAPPSTSPGVSKAALVAAPSEASRPGMTASSDFVAEAPEAHASTQVDSSLPPWEEAPEVADTGLDTQASTVTIEDADVDDDELFVEVEDEEEDEFFVEVEDDEEDDLVAGIQKEGQGEEHEFSALWSKVPILPGGQSSLIGVSGLLPAAPMVLVLIDGVSTLKGLKMLVPHVADEEFESIIEDGIARGLVVFD